MTLAATPTPCSPTRRACCGARRAREARASERERLADQRERLADRRARPTDRSARAAAHADGTPICGVTADTALRGAARGRRPKFADWKAFFDDAWGEQGPPDWGVVRTIVCKGKGVETDGDKVGVIIVFPEDNLKLVTPFYDQDKNPLWAEGREVRLQRRAACCAPRPRPGSPTHATQSARARTPAPIHPLLAR